MHHRTLILVICLLICTSCTHPPHPSARPTTPISTHPTLKPIDLHYGIYLARVDDHITVSPDGLMRSVRTENKSYGLHDIDPKLQHIEIRQGKLTPQQMADLARLFADWDSMPSNYGNVADGPDISIHYGDKTVSGGSGLPRQVIEIQAKLTELARSMPLVDH